MHEVKQVSVLGGPLRTVEQIGFKPIQALSNDPSREQEAFTWAEGRRKGHLTTVSPMTTNLSRQPQQEGEE